MSTLLERQKAKFRAGMAELQPQIDEITEEIARQKAIGNDTTDLEAKLQAGLARLERVKEVYGID